MVLVSITKRPSRRTCNSVIQLLHNKKTKSTVVCASVFISLIVIGFYCQAWFANVVAFTSTGDGSDVAMGQLASFLQRTDREHPYFRLRNSIELSRKKKKLKGKSWQQQLFQQTTSIFTQLNQLSNLLPHQRHEQDDEPQQIEQSQQSIVNNDYNHKMESQFRFAIRKECIPGRDDSNGEINPTTHRQRECLRHVPIRRTKRNETTNNHNKNSRGILNGLQTEDEVIKNLLPKPRIGLVFPPGFIGQSFAHWIADALKRTHSYSKDHSTISSLNNHNTTDAERDVDIIFTSHVPVYGYGKSHGYSKIIRFVTLPLSLAAYDAYLHVSTKSSSSSWSNVMDTSSLLETLDKIKVNMNEDKHSLPAVHTECMGRILRLILRWHCRLSHVSAHTAMITLSLEDTLKDPMTALANTLAFVWREDWEWEGVSDNHPSLLSTDAIRDWKVEANDLIVNHGESLNELLDVTSLILRESISLTTNIHHQTNTKNQNGKTLQQTIQEAFANEMEMSAGMTIWPCPSFWEGVEEEDSNKSIGDAQVLRQIADYMAPNCDDEDMFVRCAISKDRCEVKRNAKCG